MPQVADIEEHYEYDKHERHTKTVQGAYKVKSENPWHQISLLT